MADQVLKTYMVGGGGGAGGIKIWIWYDKVVSMNLQSEWVLSWGL